MLIVALYLVPYLVVAQTVLDPTRPPKITSGVSENAALIEQEQQVATGTGFPKVVVSAIFVTENDKYAIINGELVYKGQKWNNLELVDVEYNKIILANTAAEKAFYLNSNNNLKIESSDGY